MKDTGMAAFKISVLFIWGQPISIVNCNQPLGPLETQVLRCGLFVYLGFYIAFNTVQVISRRVV